MRTCLSLPEFFFSGYVHRQSMYTYVNTSFLSYTQPSQSLLTLVNYSFCNRSFSNRVGLFWASQTEFHSFPFTILLKSRGEETGSLSQSPHTHYILPKTVLLTQLVEQRISTGPPTNEWVTYIRPLVWSSFSFCLLMLLSEYFALFRQTGHPSSHRLCN